MTTFHVDNIKIKSVPEGFVVKLLGHHEGHPLYHNDSDIIEALLSPGQIGLCASQQQLCTTVLICSGYSSSEFKIKL